jgi:hypothetical protein
VCGRLNKQRLGPILYRENRVLRIFGIKGKEVTGGCRKLCDVKLYNLYFMHTVF